jgi:nitrate/TMAO reductase-like tetraheme cytochrome c subunit
MNSQPPAPPQTDSEHPFSVFRNWISVSGLVLTLSGLFSFFLLMLLDLMAKQSNPYVGILTYMVAPAFIVGGLVVFFFGGWWRRRMIIRTTGKKPTLRVDFSLPKDRKAFAAILFAGIFFLFVSAIGSYQTYHFTESVQFCGQACHQVMKPELVTYLHGPHARVSCAECHIGKGAGWFVKSKLSGTYQVYAVAFDKYPRPVPTPVKNLRPAQDTCEQCHWPQKHVGNLERTYNYFLTDPTNTPFTVRMVLNVGGADPKHGTAGGIHYHVATKVEYLATDEERQKIPYVRVTSQDGKVTEYRTPRFTNEVSEAQLRRMDCMDCHNRPAHRYQSPSKAVNLAMSLGRISPEIPSIKSNAVHALTQKYANESQALESIAKNLGASYPADPRIEKVIAEVQQIYRDNFFPEMKASWSAYPENIGHKDWMGCFRCHDDSHKSADGKMIIQSSNCNACHTIIAQGRGDDLLKVTPQGQKFKHPDGEEVEGGCNDCHTGGL